MGPGGAFERTSLMPHGLGDVAGCVKLTPFKLAIRKSMNFKCDVLLKDALQWPFSTFFIFLYFLVFV